MKREGAARSVCPLARGVRYCQAFANAERFLLVGSSCRWAKCATAGAVVSALSELSESRDGETMVRAPLLQRKFKETVQA